VQVGALAYREAETAMLLPELGAHLADCGFEVEHVAGVLLPLFDIVAVLRLTGYLRVVLLEIVAAHCLALLVNAKLGNSRFHVSHQEAAQKGNCCGNCESQNPLLDSPFMSELGVGELEVPVLCGQWAT
jgi:hypothetical protein